MCPSGRGVVWVRLGGHARTLVGRKETNLGATPLEGASPKSSLTNYTQNYKFLAQECSLTTTASRSACFTLASTAERSPWTSISFSAKFVQELRLELEQDRSLWLTLSILQVRVRSCRSRLEVCMCVRVC